MRFAAPSDVRASQSRIGSVSGWVMSRSGSQSRIATNSAPVRSIRARAAPWATTRTSWPRSTSSRVSASCGGALPLNARSVWNTRIYFILVLLR